MAIFVRAPLRLPTLRASPRFVLALLGLPILRMGPRFVLALLGLGNPLRSSGTEHPRGAKKPGTRCEAVGLGDRRKPRIGNSTAL